MKKEKREKQIMIVRFVHNNNDPLYNYEKKRKSVSWGKRKPQYNKTFSYFFSSGQSFAYWNGVHLGHDKKTLTASQSNTWDDKSFLDLIIFLSILLKCVKSTAWRQGVVLPLLLKFIKCVIQRQSRELVINNSKGSDIFAAQQHSILRGLGLGAWMKALWIY